MSSAHSWEQHRHSWERPRRPKPPGDPEWGGECSDSEEEPEMTPGEQFVDFMLSLLMLRVLSSKQFCIAMYWAAKAGLDAAAKYGKAPGDQSTGHYSRHLDPLLGFKVHNETLYETKVPGYSRNDLGRTVHKIPVYPPHENLAKDMDEETGFRTNLREQVQGGKMPPCYYDHPVVRSNPSELVAPIAVYLDFVPHSLVDSVLGIWVVNLLNDRRYLFACFRKSMVCRCGCKGWCSFHALFTTLAWSLLALARGLCPIERHDSEPWLPSDKHRSTKAGKKLPFKCAPMYVKADWSEVGGSLGLPNWADGLRPCYECNGFGSDLFELSQCSFDELRWRCNQLHDYASACTRCEIRRELTEPIRAAFVERLHYDKRPGGSKGRALTRDFAPLGLRAGDRLEPSMGLFDVGAVEDLLLPAEIIMWRPSEESLARHRNPLFHEELGLLPQRSLVADTLHCLYLGVMQVWCRTVLWMLLDAGIYGEAGTAEEKLAVSLQALKHSLRMFYLQRHHDRPSENLTHISDITAKMIGTRNEPKCKFKGAETQGLLHFLISESRKHAPRLGGRGVRLLLAGQSLEKIVSVWHQHGRVLPVDARRVLNITSEGPTGTNQLAKLNKPKQPLNNFFKPERTQPSY